MSTDSNSGQLIRTARRLFEKGEFAEAEKAWTQVRDRLADTKGRQLDAELIIAACQEGQGHFDQALQTMRNAVARDKNRADSWFQLGRLQRRVGDTKAAADALGQAITLNPNHALARVELGRQALAAGNSDGAERHFLTALRADPDCVPALISLASSLLDNKASSGEKESLEQAHKHAARAVQLRPQNPEAQLVMARVFERLGNPDFAQRCLENALGTAPGHIGLNRACARLLVSRGQPGRALEVIDRARRRGIDDGQLVLLEARIFQQLSQSAQARDRYEHVFANHRDHMDARDLLALAELRLNHRDLQAAAQLVEPLENAWPSAGKLIHAQLIEPQDKLEEAALLASDLHNDPDEYIQRQARVLSAHLALRRSQPAAAVAALQPLQQAGRLSPFMHWLLARAHEETGQHKIAADHLRQAGWRTSTHILELEKTLNDTLYEQLAAFEFSHWPTQPPDDGYPQPLFLLGWPGSGRDQLLEAISGAAAGVVMERSDALRRREALAVSSTLEELDALEDSQIKQARKLYFRAGTLSRRALEPLWLPFAALPAIARYFPGAPVIIVDTEEHDAELNWRFDGLRSLEEMRALWQREQGVLEHLLDVLPLDFEVLSLADLHSDPDAAAQQIGRALGLKDVDGWSGHIQRQLSRIRPAGHWKNYASLFSPPAES